MQIMGLYFQLNEMLVHAEELYEQVRIHQGEWDLTVWELEVAWSRERAMLDEISSMLTWVETMEEKATMSVVAEEVAR